MIEDADSVAGLRDGTSSWAENEARYRLLAENSADVIYVVDKAGVMLYVSPACRAMTGWEPYELVGRSGYDFIHPDDLAAVAEAHASLLDGPTGLTAPPYRTRRKDGSYVWVESTLRPIPDPVSGGILEIQASARDVTDRVEAQRELERMHRELERKTHELERSNLELEQFAFDASHDLVEPLRIMSRLARTFAERYGHGLDGEGRQIITSILDGTERMRMLISDLLEYSRVSREPLERTWVNCQKALEEAVELLSETVAEKNAVITSDPLPTVEAHPAQFRQLLQNLLSNALKFASDSPLRLHVSAHRDGDFWEFSVSDNGVGIDPRQSKRVFELFGRVQASDAYAGTGMGLSICKRIAERHGGRIWVESAEGEGSVFSFTIPDRV